MKVKISICVSEELLEKVAGNRSQWFERAGMAYIGREQAEKSQAGKDPWGKLGELEKRVEALENPIDEPKVELDMGLVRGSEL